MKRGKGRDPDDGPDIDYYFGHPLLTDAADEQATRETHHRLLYGDDDPDRFLPWTLVLP